MASIVVYHDDRIKVVGYASIEMRCKGCDTTRTVSWSVTENPEPELRYLLEQEFRLDHVLCEPGREIDILTGNVVG